MKTDRTCDCMKLFSSFFRFHVYRYNLYNSLHPKHEKFSGREVTKRHDSDNEEYAAWERTRLAVFQFFSIKRNEISIFI